MAKQIFYIDDPKGGRGWKVVQKIEHRGLYDIPDRDPANDDDYGDVADQQLETFNGTWCRYTARYDYCTRTVSGSRRS